MNKVGIRLRESPTEWRNLEDVIDEVGQRWESFNDIEKSAITTALAGTRQRDKLIATFDNYDKVLQATEVSLNSAGTAEEKYADYMDSIDAKINQFIATWEQFVNNLNGSGAFSGIIDIGTKLIGILDVLINKFGLIQNVGVPTFVIAGFIKLSGYIKNVYQNLSTVGNVINKFKDIEIIKDSSGKIKNVKQLSDSLVGLSLKQKLLVLSTKNLTNEEKKQILVKSGVSKKNAEAALSTQTYSTATVGATATTSGFTASLTALKAAFLANPITAIITVLTTVISAITLGLTAYNQKIQETIDKSKELVDAHNSAKRELQSGLDTLVSVQEEFEILSNGVDKNGKNISLTADEYNRYNEIIREILEISPSLITGYTEEGKAISSNNDLLKEAIELQKQKILLELKESTSASTLWDIQSGNIEEYKKKQEELKKANDSFSSIYNKYFTGGLFGNQNKEQIEFFHNISEEITGLSQEELDNLSYSNPESVTEKWFEPLKDNAEKIYNEMTARTDLFSSEDLAIFSAYVEKKKLISDQLEPISKKINESLLDVPRTLGDTYDSLSDEEKKFISQYIKNLDVSTEKMNEQNGEAAMEQIRQNILDLTNKIAEDEDLKIHFEDLFDTENLEKLNIGDYKKSINNSIKEISESLGMSEEEVKLRLNIDDSTYDTLLNSLKSKFKEAGTEIGTELDDLSINNLQLLEKNITSIANLGSWSEIEERLKAIHTIQENSKETTSEYINQIKSLQDTYSTLTDVVNEYNSANGLSIESIDKLISMDSEQLKYLNLQNGELTLNKELLIADAEAALQNAINREKTTIATEQLNQATMIDTFMHGELTEAQDASTQAMADEATQAGLATPELLAHAEAARKDAEARANAAGIDWDKLTGSEAWKTSIKNEEKAKNNVEILESAVGRLGVSFESTASSAKSTTDAWKSEFERAYKDLQYQRDMDLIDAKTYYTQLAALNQKYFAGNEKYLDDYQKYSKEVYQGLKKLAEEQMKAEAQAHIDSIDRRIKRLQDEKSALRERNEEEDLALRLQKARDRYEAAKGQLTNRVYTNEKGWEWQVDTKELQEAKEEMESIQKEIDLKRAEQAIDDQIADLERLKEKWEEYMDNISAQLEELGFEIDENGNIVLKNAELAEQGYNQMTGANNNYANAVANSSYIVENSLGRIRTAIQSIGDEDFKKLSENFTKTLEEMRLELSKLEMWLNIVLLTMNILRNGVVEDLTKDVKDLNKEGIEKLVGNLKILDQEILVKLIEKIDGLRNGAVEDLTLDLQDLCENALQCILTTLKDIDAVNFENIMFSLDNLKNKLLEYNSVVVLSTEETLLFRDMMENLGITSVQTFSDIQQAIDSIGVDSLDPIMSKIQQFVSTIIQSFQEIAQLLSTHVSQMQQTAMVTQSSFSQMSVAANGFATTMQNVENMVVSALRNIEIAAQAAVVACKMAEDAAVRAESAAIRAADSAARALSSAQQAEASAKAAAASADSAASSARSAASSAASAASSARSAASSASKASNAGKGSRAGGIEMGAVDWTGLTMLHGTPSNPEYVLTSNQMENFVKNMSRAIPAGRISNTNNEVTNNKRDGDIIIKDCTFPLNNVREPRDFTAALKQIARQNRR